jgi:hypothetical protein
MVPISLVGTSLTASVNSTDPVLRNLGNWCVQNLHNITLYNNMAGTKTIYGYLGSNIQETGYTINRGGVVKSFYFPSTGTKYRTWKWCEVILNSGETTTFDFQQVACSYFPPAAVNEWKLG